MVRLEELLKQGTRDEFDPNKHKRVGSYVLGRSLGEGSFAKVRLGVHVLTKEKVAIKVINKRLVEKREYVRKNMRREAVVLQRLDHPNIVRIYEILETENSFYIVMELAECGDMMKHINDRNGISESEARRFMRQLVSALDHMHRSGVVHRDLKVENLLLNKDLSLKIIDFGLSNFFDGENLLSTQCGSPAYAAPEIFNKKQYGPGVDVWSIGVNLYAMVTGNLPFEVDPPRNLVKLHAMILRGCKIPPSLSSGCQELLRAMLEVDETKRISLCDVMKHPWLNDEYIPLEPWPLKKVMQADSIDEQVIVYMKDILSHPEADTRDALFSGRPSALAATYHLLVQRLDRNLTLPMQDRDSGQVAAMTMEQLQQQQTDMEERIDDASKASQYPDNIDMQPKELIARDTLVNYRQCLKKLKANRERSDLILGRQSALKRQDPVDEVAAVNMNREVTSHQQEHTRFSIPSRGRTLAGRLRTAPGGVLTIDDQTKLTAADIRFLSDKFLRHRITDERFSPSSRPQTRTDTAVRDPSHRLRIMQLTQQCAPNMPPAPPNSAEARKRSQPLPALIPAKDDGNNKQNDKGRNYGVSKQPIVFTRDNPIPDPRTDRFYDKYRFKVRNSEGERTLAWDISVSELPACGGVGSRTKTLPDMRSQKMSTTHDKCKDRMTRYSAGDSVNLKKLGLSYALPEHSTAIPKSRKSHTEAATNLANKRIYRINKQTNSQPNIKQTYTSTQKFVYPDNHIASTKNKMKAIPVSGSTG